CPSLYPGGASIGPKQIHQAIEGSLGRLKTDRLDIWMFHRDDPSLPLGPLIDALDEEIQSGRLGAWGASNWTTARLQEAIDLAASTGKAAPVASSPNFSLAHANEPYWPDTVVTSADDRAWFTRTSMPLVAWSSLGRGFFSHGREDDRSNADLVRVYYSKENFSRKHRAEALAGHKGCTLFEIAIGWVISQPFPVTALCGARTLDEVATALLAGDLQLSVEESRWLDGTSAKRPF
ncbi:MAG: aldo/keto reductase, partial [Pseudomonadota bacterium]